jgi:hypothetical protein
MGLLRCSSCEHTRSRCHNHVSPVEYVQIIRVVSMSKIHVVCSVPVEKWYTYEINVDDDYIDEIVDDWGDNETSELREIILARYRPDLVDIHIHESIKAEENRKYSKLLIYPETEEDYREMMWGMKNLTNVHIYQPSSPSATDNLDGAVTDEQV